LGVFGHAPLGTKISAKGFDGVDGVCVHNLTLTKPDAISKDIDARAARVLAFYPVTSWPFNQWLPSPSSSLHPVAPFTQ